MVCDAEPSTVAAPALGSPANLVEFGHSIGAASVEWDEPREIREIRVRFAAAVRPDSMRIEYWSAGWPPREGRGGWTVRDSPFAGEWRRAFIQTAVEGGQIIFTFAPLSAEENPNQKNQPTYTPMSRVTLKVRIVSETTLPELRQFEIYGDAVWNRRSVFVHADQPVEATIYNGRILEKSSDANGRVRMLVAYLEHPAGTHDGTVISIRTAQVSFGVGMDDVVLHHAMYVRPAAVFVTDVVNLTLKTWLARGHYRPAYSIRSKVSERPEQSLERAMAEIPALAKTANNGRHPVRYVPLGVPGVREKFGLEHNGNLFISKHGSKLFEEERTRMRWEGDKIRFRIATGNSSDYRERERGAMQEPLKGELPVIVTRWSDGPIEYEEEAFATVLADIRSPWALRGDEPAVALIRLRAKNAGSVRQDLSVWLHVDPEEPLSLEDGLLFAGKDRYRAVLTASRGGIGLDGKHSVRWQPVLDGGAQAELVIAVPFRTFQTAAEMAAVRRLRFEEERTKTFEYWTSELNKGMRISVPDRAFNAFFRTNLQHMLLSVQRDVQTGLYMLPCGTYDYNMYLNETDMQIRLLDMRGLHDYAERFLEPMIRFQGSKAFPGLYKSSDGIFHGIRIDDSDYTHWGYNLNHGWTMWTLAEHYRFTRDRAWLQRVRPNLIRAAEWILRERREANQPEGERGLLPAGQLEDNEELRHWFAVNAYAYRGLRAVADAVKDLDAGEAGRLSREADSYRADIRKAVLQATSQIPVALLRDGSWTPVVAPRTRLHGRDYGWIRNILYGAHVLIDCGIFAPDEPVAEWILDDLEDNLFLSADTFGVAEQDWFSRGGIAHQPNLVNTAVTYLARGDAPQALRAMYNTFAASYYPDVNAFTEWLPSFGRSGGPYYKTSDEAGFLTWLRLLLVREDGDTLLLSSGAPRHWFRSGQTIEVENAATFFGNVSFNVKTLNDSHVTARVKLSPLAKGRKISMKVRHAGGGKLVRATIDGETVPIDASRETITWPSRAGEVHVDAYFELEKR